MNKIGIDARLYSQTGIGTYITNLLHYLPMTNIKNSIFYIYLLKEIAGQVKLDNKNFILKYTSCRWHSASEQIIFLEELYRENLDLMHFPYFSYPILYSKPFIATIHDLTPLLLKTGKASTKNPIYYQIKYWFFKQILSNQVKNSKAIITPTNAVKNQIIDRYGKDYHDKIFPIYEGVNYTLLKTKENNKLRKLFNSNFFIYVGNFYPHKNVEKLIKAFSKIDSKYKLVLIGPNDFFTKRLFQLINKLNQQKRIIFYHKSSPADLAFFYKNALALIHPSLSEGFGLPLVEAAYFNCPIIASDIPVFKELLSYSYISFNPYSEQNIKEKIESFINNKERKIINYCQIMNKFSFESMTQKTVLLYKQLLTYPNA